MGSPAANPNFAAMTMAFNAATYSAYKRLFEQNIIKKSLKKIALSKNLQRIQLRKHYNFLFLFLKSSKNIINKFINLSRYWNIMVSQIDCNTIYSAPVVSIRGLTRCLGAVPSRPPPRMIFILNVQIIVFNPCTVKEVDLKRIFDVLIDLTGFVWSIEVS